MQPDPNAPFSDLERARVFSRNLRRPRRPAVQTDPPALPASESAYVAEPESRVDVSAMAPAAEEIHIDEKMLGVLESGNLGSRFWNSLLAQCLDLIRMDGGEAAFAVDEQGLCIAQVGGLEEEELEGTGSRLVIALEQAARMESFQERKPASILIEFEDRWLTGLVVQCSTASRIVVGLIARNPLSSRSRESLTNMIGETLFCA